MKNKKILWYSLLGLDVALTIFLFVVSIIMLAKTVGQTQAEFLNGTGFIGYLQNHTTVFLVAFVVPLFLLLAANIVGLVIYVKKQAQKEKSAPLKVDDLNEEQKDLLKQELLKELQRQSEDK